MVDARPSCFAKFANARLASASSCANKSAGTARICVEDVARFSCKDSSTARMSGRARDGRLVHFTPGGQQVRPGDVVTTTVTRAAPHHLIADGELLSWRRTRAGDAHAAGTQLGARGAKTLSLGMPPVGKPPAEAQPMGCAQ